MTTQKIGDLTSVHHYLKFSLIALILVLVLSAICFVSLFVMHIKLSWKVERLHKQVLEISADQVNKDVPVTHYSYDGEKQNRIKRSFLPSQFQFDTSAQTNMDRVGVGADNDLDYADVAATKGNKHGFQDFNWRSHSTQNAHISGRSVYTRWGRPTCPGESKLIYYGYIAGPSGNAGVSSLMCLPSRVPSHEDASFNHPWAKAGFTIISPANFNSRSERGFSKQGVIHCAVCLSKHSNQVMVPGWQYCPNGWRMEYKGRLTGATAGKSQSLSHICMDDKPTVSRGVVFSDSVSLSYIQYKGCPGHNKLCNEYRPNAEMPCTVCTREFA